MRTTAAAFAISTLAATAVGHATFQELWVGSTDEESTCARLPVGLLAVLQDILGWEYTNFWQGK